jgi:branched-chain amino acid transport system permease protein
VVLGGMGSTPGIVLGAVFVSVTPELLRSFADWRLLAFGLLLIVAMIFRPQGIWPATTAWRRDDLEEVRREPVGG